MSQMTPQDIVHELDKHIVGQDAAKRACAIALRNRWRRMQVEGSLRQEITPKNILIINVNTEIYFISISITPRVKMNCTQTEYNCIWRDRHSLHIYH